MALNCTDDDQIYIPAHISFNLGLPLCCLFPALHAISGLTPPSAVFHIQER